MSAALKFIFKTFFSFLLRQKRNKKGDPKTITARFRGGSLIRLLYYCVELHLSTVQRLIFQQAK